MQKLIGMLSKMETQNSWILHIGQDLNEAPESDDEDELRDNRCFEAVRQWQKDHFQAVNEGSFEFLKVAETSIQLRAWGMLLELVLPVGLFQEDNVSDESFMAIALDESGPGNLLVALNEKLERVKKTPGAIPRVLDVLSQTLRAYVKKRGEAGIAGRHNVDSRKDVGNSSQEGSDNDEGDRLNRGNDHVDVSRDTGAASEDDFGVGPMAGSNQISYVQEQSVERDEYDEMEQSGESDEYDEMEQSDESDEYDEIEDFTGYDDFLHTRLADECTPVGMVDGSPCLFDLLVQARSRCDEARKRGEKKQIPAAAQPSGFHSASALFEEDEILQFVAVSAVPHLGCVRIRAEVSGIVSSLKVATALGFTPQGSLQIWLELDEKNWSRKGFLEPPKVGRISVNVDDNLEHDSDFQQQSNDSVGEGSSTQKLQNEGLFVGEGTYITILLQELINSFFHERTLAARANSLPPREQLGALAVTLKRCLESKNPIIGLVCFLGTQLRALPGCCVSCWSPLPMSAGRIRTCQKELCLFKFEEIGLGAMAVHQEIKESPALVEFELSLACAAAKGTRDVFEPFPAFLLQKPEIRGRSGNFSDASRASMLMAGTRTQALEGIQYTRTDNKRLSLLLKALQTIPKITSLHQCADENALRRIMASASSPLKDEQDSKEVWWSKMVLSYNLLRFILSTNQLSLYELTGDKIPFWIQSRNQFIALSDFPEKEARFERQKRERGSFFAFHGSRQSNWYSIMRNGIRCLSKTTYMLNGAAHGDGIYLASDLSTSFFYATSTDGMSVFAICEVINGSCRTAPPPGRFSTATHVVPVEREANVAVRYIIAFSDISPQDNCMKAYINGSTLHDPGKRWPEVDLGKHYSEVRLKHDTMLRVRLEDQRRKAKLKLRELSMAEIGFPGVPNAPASSGNAPSSSNNPAKGNGAPRQQKPTTEDGSPGRKRPTTEEGASRQKRPNNDIVGAAPTRASMQAVAKEFKNLLKEIDNGKDNPFLSNIVVTIPDEADMHVWNIMLCQDLFQSYPKLYKDLSYLAAMQNQPKGNVLLEAIFPTMYPFAPPFIRIVRPKFSFHTGHVTVGGSICMELLTDSGWLPTFSFESVLVQIVNAMVEGEGRIDLGAVGKEYSKQEAKDAFSRVARTHGWTVGT